MDTGILFVLEAFGGEVEPFCRSGASERVEVYAHRGFIIAVYGGNTDFGDGSNLRSRCIGKHRVSLHLFRDDGHRPVVKTGAQDVKGVAGITGTVHSFGITQIDLTQTVSGNTIAEAECHGTHSGRGIG